MSEQTKRIDFAGLLMMSFCTLALTSLGLMTVAGAIEAAKESWWLAVAVGNLAALCFAGAAIILAWSIRDRIWEEINEH